MVEHVSIADADRHEVKHASTAVSNQALLANGDGTTRFSFISYSDISGLPVAAGYRQVLTSASTASTQNPSAVDTPLQVEFGPAQTTADASLAANGTLTLNTSGDYAITLFLRFGRTTGAGSAVLLNRFLVNGVQGLNSNALKLADQDTIIPFSTTLYLQANAGATFQLQIMRDSSGINNGGLFRVIPALAGWNIAPSATIVVNKFRGLL